MAGDASTTSVTVTCTAECSEDESHGDLQDRQRNDTITQADVGKPAIGPMPQSDYDAIVGAPFSLAIPTQNGPVTYTATKLPPGLKLSNVTGIISGVPQTAVVTR